MTSAHKDQDQEQHHPITLPVSSLSPATTLYTRALAPLGYTILPTATPTTTTNIGLPSTMQTTLILSASSPVQSSYPTAYDLEPAYDMQKVQRQSRRKKKPHIIFPATIREQVDAFFAEAVSAGGDARNGFEPNEGKEIGVWEAGVRDPDGNLLVVRFTSPNEEEEEDGDAKSPASHPSEVQKPAEENAEVDNEEEEEEPQDPTSIELWRQDVASKRAALSTSASDVSVSESDSDSDSDAYAPRTRQGPAAPRTTRYVYHYPRRRSSSPPSSASSHPSLKLSSYKPHTGRPDENTSSYLPPHRRHSSNTNTSTRVTHIKTAVLGATAALALSYIFNSPSSSAISSSGARKESVTASGAKETRGVGMEEERDRDQRDGERKKERPQGRRHTVSDSYCRTYTRQEQDRYGNVDPYARPSVAKPISTIRTRTNAYNTLQGHKAANQVAEDHARVGSEGKRDETTLYRTRTAPQARAQPAAYTRPYEQKRVRERESGRERERERWGRGGRW